MLCLELPTAGSNLIHEKQGSIFLTESPKLTEGHFPDLVIKLVLYYWFYCRERLVLQALLDKEGL